jgi:hypothetical protein
VTNALKRKINPARGNGAIVPKHIGYGCIDAKHADAISDFYCEYLNPYLNYHCPRAQAEVKMTNRAS